MNVGEDKAPFVGPWDFAKPGVCLYCCIVETWLSVSFQMYHFLLLPFASFRKESAEQVRQITSVLLNLEAVTCQISRCCFQSRCNVY